MRINGLLMVDEQLSEYLEGVDEGWKVEKCSSDGAAGRGPGTKAGDLPGEGRGGWAEHPAGSSHAPAVKS